VKFHINIDNYCIKDVDFRPGMKSFLEQLLNVHNDVLVVSAGVKNYINNFFSYHDFALPDLHIIANEFITDNDGNAIGYDKNLITSFTKQHLDYTDYSV
jgi:2-hydroxy-3-keto-5-methylthiopentenyl-1-phosphate phosphatase